MPEGYHKLVRDKIPEHLKAKDVPFEQNIATPEEYKKRLLEKLSEEIKEFREAGDIEELADIIEVIEALKKLPEFANVEEIRKKKLAEKGGFDQKIILKGEKN